MESRTKFMGPVMAMLALSSLSYSGFISPPPEQLNSEEEDSDTRTPAERLLEDSSAAQPGADGSGTSNSADLPASDSGETSPALPPPPSSDSLSSGETLEPTPERASEIAEEVAPVSLIDWLFVPLPDAEDAPGNSG